MSEPLCRHPVALVAVLITLGGCATKPASRSLSNPKLNANAIGPASRPLVRLRRTECLGWCPVYDVAIDDRGAVSYLGRDNVMTVGPAGGQLSAQELRSLQAAVSNARRAELPPGKCVCDCTADAPGVELTISGGDMPGRGAGSAPRAVYYDEGCDKVPAAMRQLELDIDRAVQIERWIGTPAVRRACFLDHRDCPSFVGASDSRH